MRKPESTVSYPNYYPRGVPYSENAIVRSSVIEILCERDILSIREAGIIAYEIIEECRKIISPGITTDAIDEFVSNECNKRKVYPSLLNYRGFPKSVATNVNEVANLGIPDQRELQSDDILNLQLGIYHRGFHASITECFEVGPENKHAELIELAERAMQAALNTCKLGEYYREIGKAIDAVLKDTGYYNVHDHYGRGINYVWRAQPKVPSYYINTPGIILPGHVFTIHVVITKGSPDYRIWPNGTVSVTELGTHTAQKEHTISVKEDGPHILTSKSD